jgi:hypothetical protein
MRYLALIAVVAALAFGQPYRCDWSTNGIAGGEMTSSSYRVGATAGIPAGYLIGSSLQAFIGFWQTEAQVGIREAAQWPSGQALQTRLCAPQPNPARGSVVIRYSLEAERSVLLQVHDLAGRVVRTLCASSKRRGAYSIAWDGCDASGTKLAEGVYFVRLTAGGYLQTEKVLLTK